MSRQIVIEFPDGAGDGLYDDVFTAVSNVARSVAGAAGAAPPVVFSEPGRPPAPVPRQLPPLPRHPTDPARGFAVDLRGYDRAEVCHWVEHVRTMPPPHPKPTFGVVLRGYRRREVDEWVGQVLGVG